MEIYFSCIGLILVIMQTPTNRNKIFQWLLSAITAGWIYWNFIGHFTLFTNKEFNDWNKILEYLSSEILMHSVILTIIVYVVFYVLLEKIVRLLFYKKIDSYYNNFFKKLTPTKKQIYLKWIIWGLKNSRSLKSVLPNPQGNFEDSLNSLFIHFTILLHFIICIIILEIKIYSILIPFGILFLGIIPCIKPIAKHIVWLFESGEIKPEEIK